MSDDTMIPANDRDITALEAIRAVWPEDKECPLNNNGERYSCDLFCFSAYNWHDDERDSYANLLWRDWIVRWYKYAGRGTYVNRHITPGEIVELLADINKEFDL